MTYTVSGGALNSTQTKRKPVVVTWRIRWLERLRCGISLPLLYHLDVVTTVRYVAAVRSTRFCSLRTRHLEYSLRINIRLTDSHAAFRRALMSHLFNTAYIQFITRIIIWTDLCTAPSRSVPTCDWALLLYYVCIYLCVLYVVERVYSSEIWCTRLADAALTLCTRRTATRPTSTCCSAAAGVVFGGLVDGSLLVIEVYSPYIENSWPAVLKYFTN